MENKNSLNCKVIMLPTEKESSLGLNKNTNKLYLTGRAVSHESQHIYLVSDRDITEYDWITDGLNVVQAKLSSVASCWAKIEATTDASLGHWKEVMNNNNEGDTDTLFPLPQIPQSFIEDFVKSEGNIDIVHIELNESHYHEIGGMPCVGDYSPKVNENGFVTIKSIK